MYGKSRVWRIVLLSESYLEFWSICYYFTHDSAVGNFQKTTQTQTFTKVTYLNPPKLKKRDFAKRLHNLIANYRALVWGLVPEYFKVAITHFIFMVSLFDSYRRRFNFPRNFMSCWRNVCNIYTSKERFLTILLRFFWSNTYR